MTMHIRNSTPPGRREGARAPVRFALASVCAALGFAAACHLLDISNPDVVPAGTLTGAANLPTIRGGAIGDFALAYSGSGATGSQGTIEGQIMVSGLLSDEWINTETFPDRVQVDARQTDPTSGTMAGVFTTLARARVSTEYGVAQFRQFADTTTNTGLSELLSLNGFTYLMFAENYCSGVPFDNPQPDGTVIFGQPLTTMRMLDTALNRFNQAIATAKVLPVAQQPPFLRLAAIGKARALLDEGLDSIADTVVSAANVPTGFSYVIQHDLTSLRQQNGVFAGDAKYKRYGVADKEGGNGIPWRSSPDPRTPFFRKPATNKGFDNSTPQYDEYRYIDERASVTLATGAEARLINAEAALQRGDTVTFLAILNGLRAAPPPYFLVGDTTGLTSTVAPLSPLASPTSDTAAVSLLFNERAHWLWLTGHRLNDLRRLVRTKGVRGGFGRAVNSVFPTGPYFKNGLTYGNDVNLPVPVTEQNNPNFQQCLDRLP
ncbi:MAG TPA: hypothetical protein VM716_15650 [Gemmatimonadales bacterium]|nr:hypothetical protein [Gemmatimonadales bacterium]